MELSGRNKTRQSLKEAPTSAPGSSRTARAPGFGRCAARISGCLSSQNLLPAHGPYHLGPFRALATHRDSTPDAALPCDDALEPRHRGASIEVLVLWAAVILPLRGPKARCPAVAIGIGYFPLLNKWRALFVRHQAESAVDPLTHALVQIAPALVDGALQRE